jgi:nitrite reductase/ring-hydroxylating ferredoxin subunit
MTTLAGSIQRMTYLCKAADVPLNGCKRVTRGRHPAVAVFNLGGEFFAIADVCTHGNASLSAGEIDGGEIICPLHYGSFDIRTGAAVELPCNLDLQVYPVSLSDGEIHIAPAD